MKSRIDWIIHGCANGVVCEYFGETENGFLPGTCNFHTHGMEKYSHLDFQMTLAYPRRRFAESSTQWGFVCRPESVSKTAICYPEFTRIAMYG